MVLYRGNVYTQVMVKVRISNWFFVVLVAALLSMQWTTRHVHLSQSHNHGDAQHKHAAVAHSHLPTGHHEDSIDVADAHTDYTVVELSESATGGSLAKLGHGFIASLFPALVVAVPQQRGSPPPRERFVSYRSYLEQSTVRLRAPPVLA